MTELIVGVVGVGEMGKRHAENMRHSVPQSKLVAVADANLERAQAVASELNISSAYHSVEELVGRPDIQAVVISSPPKYHFSAILAAAAAGKHIFCEKPLALTVKEADNAIAAVERAGVILQVGHMRRFDSPYVEAKRRIDAGEIGQVVIFKSIGRDQESSPAGACQVDLNGTLFHDSSSHDFDLARWLTNDEVVEVHAYGAALAIPQLKELQAFDAGVVNLQFAGGAIGNVESFMDAKYGYDIRTEIVGTEGTIAIGHIRQTPLVMMTRAGSSHDLIGHWLVRFAEAYRREMCEFVQTVLQGLQPKVTGHDGRQSLAVAEAAVQSFRQRQPVRVQLAAALKA